MRRLRASRKRCRRKSYNGAPRPMKMGTIVSPWRYDAIADDALRPTNLRWPAIFRYVSWAAVFRVSIAGLSINLGIDVMGQNLTRTRPITSLA
jgi:hypothetical protein